MAAGDYQLKFVVATAPDIEEIGKLIGALAMPPQPHKVLLMPEGITPSALRERQDLLVQLCKEHGYRFCSRLHVDLFGNTPGT